MTEDAARLLALQLLDEHKREIANHIVELSSRTVPAVNVIDTDARIASIMTMLAALVRSLKSGSDEEILSLIFDLGELRRAAGVDVRGLIAVSHCYLPVIRRVMVARADDPLLGLRAFDAIESPTMEIVVAGMMASLPDLSRDSDFLPIADDDDLDPTDPQRVRFPFTEVL